MEFFLNRKVTEQITLTDDPLHSAYAWLYKKGYDYGTKNENDYIPVMKGYYDKYDIPMLWKELTPQHKRFIHGVITGDIKNGPITIYLFK